MHVVCNLSVGGVSLNVTLGGAKENTVTDYKDSFAKAIKENTAWREPHVTAILTRTAMTRIYAQCLSAATQARESGTLVDLETMRDRGTDAVLVSARGRSVSFMVTDGNKLGVVFQGFPESTKTAQTRVVEMPASAEIADDWAKARVSDAITVLMQNA